MLQRKRPISILICVVMLLTLMPAQSVFGEESGMPQEDTIRQESGTQQAVTVSASNAETLYASVKAEYNKVTYEDLYGVWDSYGSVSTEARQMYMDKLGMRDSFNEVKGDLDAIMLKVLDNSDTSYMTTEYLNRFKLQVIFALTYLDKYYSFEAGGLSAKDIILYFPEKVGGTRQEAFTVLTGIGGMEYYSEALGTATAKSYTKWISGGTGKDDITGFLEAMLKAADPSAGADEYLLQSNAVIEERGATSLFAKMQSDDRLKSYLLPLLSLSTESVYVISTDYTTTFGLTSTYGGAEDESFKTQLAKAADSQKAFLDFWKRISKTSNKLDAGQDVVLIDALAKKGTEDDSTSQLWSAEYGDSADPGVREFMTPMGLYRAYTWASAEADTGNLMVRFFMGRALTDGGINTYTHELTHIYDKTVWLNGYGTRTGVGGEAFARGLFESENNTQPRDGGESEYAPYFNLNTAYTLGDNRIQNQSPERFDKSEDLGEYMRGLMDVIYTLDIIEAEEILKMSDADKAILFNKVSLVDDESQVGRKLDKFENITEEEASQLKTLDDLVEHNIVSGRLLPKGSETTQTIPYNEYVVVPMFEGVYAGLQNDAGNTGEFLFRRYSHELLGEYGWEKGMVAYVSDQYANDGEALNAILDDEYGGSLAAFKKDMFKRRADKLDDLKATATYKDAEAMRQAISAALQKDLADMKKGISNASDSDPYASSYMLYVKEVQNVKADIFKEYLLMTEDFTKSIYEDSEAGGDAGGDTGGGAEEKPTPTPTPTPDPKPTPTPIPSVAAQKTVTANLCGHDDFLIKWSSQNVAGATVKYKVQYKKYGGKWSNLSTGTTGTSLKKANLADGARYAFRVTPYVTVNGKTYTGKAKDTAYVYTLKKISKPKAKKKSKNYIKVSWKNIPGETGYQIARSTKKSKGYKVVKTVKSTKAKSTNLKTKRKKNYYYKVRAYKTVDGKKIYGPWSSPRKYRLR